MSKLKRRLQTLDAVGAEVVPVVELTRVVSLPKVRNQLYDLQQVTIVTATLFGCSLTGKG